MYLEEESKILRGIVKHQQSITDNLLLHIDSIHERAKNELDVMHNFVAQRESSVMNEIGILTFLFFPGTFIASLSWFPGFGERIRFPGIRVDENQEQMSITTPHHLLSHCVLRHRIDYFLSLPLHLGYSLVKYKFLEVIIGWLLRCGTAIFMIFGEKRAGPVSGGTR
ncbi:hypothetical protein B0J12DRAFT_250021 [Macrophomina phaseolina]|uniref:Uncharacterized protein n=1 Tax=Macrophomina phaseolina TaxID=35725 RepID=A0ABQ8G007_9PEZI|nr:hypothetical protein B0J12DRAFT_250021 [Macrophomina phaseolina]